MARRENSEINAGSMADIAFLLLIFFLVTTTMDVDSGISRKLPEKSEDTPEVTIKQKNVLDITVNRNNQILIEGTDFVQVTDIRRIAMDFIDNGGGESAPKPDGTPGVPCDYCQGAKDPASSDHPSKAIISLQSDRGTTYGMYVSIQNEIEAAYNELRNRLALEKYKRTYSDLLKDYNDNGGDKLKEKIDFLKDSYPQIITEPEPIK
ncbi:MULTISPECIES: ExbD/TolR family protein [Flavobacteriaceae]|uniref:Biopolymer transporter ExbD n=2 Tax=Flavobacteriaceae TaxID=49546 RepID=A0A4Y8ASQ3_9FLAO|nr:MULTISPECIES: biopolymer transporter ExbD [Flavobacteriaceae]TEW74909.1 biopolymer transporter ExbD [Gramella jeungdoensis]GGK43146.1 biopolymer transporter ExbD [Lutibacter litoralis]